MLIETSRSGASSRQLADVPRREPIDRRPEVRPDAGGSASRVVEAMAVLGPLAPVWALAELARLPVPELLSVVDDLVLCGLVTRESPIRFSDEQVRASVLTAMPPAARISAHLEAAQLLYEAGAPAANVAEQLLCARPGGVPWAVGTLRAAARGAVPEKAESFLRRALHEPISGRERVGVLIDLATVRSRIDSSSAVGFMLGELQTGQPPEDFRELVEAARRILVLHGRYDEVPRVLDQVRGGLGESDHRALAGLYLSGAAFQNRVIAGVGDLESAVAWLQDTASEGAEVKLPLRAARAGLATLKGRDAADAVLDAKTVLAEADPRSDFDLCWQALFALVIGGKAVASESDALLLRQDVVRSGDEWDLAELDLLRAHGLRRQGDLVGAIAALGDLQPRVQEIGDQSLQSRVTCCLAEAMAAVGDHARAKALLRSPEMRAEPGALATTALFLFTRGAVLAGAGQLHAAVHAYRACGQRLAGSQVDNPELLRWRHGLVPVLLELQLVDEARRLAEENLRLALGYGAEHAVGSAKYVMALTRPTMERRALLGEAVESARRSGYALDEAMASCELATVLRTSGDERGAHQRFLRALALAERCGARALAEQARRLAGAPMPRRGSGPIDRSGGLTRQEWKVARLAADGLSNPGIASALCLARRTVEFHLTGVYRKLNVRGRTELIGLLRDRA